MDDERPVPKPDEGEILDPDFEAHRTASRDYCNAELKKSLDARDARTLSRIRGLVAEAEKSLDECERFNTQKGVPFAYFTLIKALEMAAEYSQKVDWSYLSTIPLQPDARGLREVTCVMTRQVLGETKKILDECEPTSGIPFELMSVTRAFSMLAKMLNNSMEDYTPPLDERPAVDSLNGSDPSSSES